MEKKELTIKEHIGIAIQRAEKAAEVWFKENEYDIETKIKQMLDLRLEEIVAKVLGFNLSYGSRWEVDHCNRRSGESLIGDWIRVQAKESAERWMAEQIKNLPPLPAGAVRSARKFYLEVLEYEVHELLKTTAWEKREEAIQQVLGELKHGNS